MKDFETDDESSIWPWVTGIVLLAMVIWVAAELSTGDTPSAAPVTTAATTAQAPPRPAASLALDSVITPGAFHAWVTDSADVPEWSDDDAFVQAGLGRLAAALGGLARLTESAELQQRAAALQHSLDGYAGATAAADDPAHAAVQEASAIAEVLHEQLGPGEDDTRNIAEALGAAAELDPDQPIKLQRQRLYHYLTVMAQSLMSITL